ncbi:hypothetical protein ACFQZ4_42075 [Catellatospora coxensis]
MLVAALISLPLGAVLGPEAPLIAGGGGLALLAAHAFGISPATGAPSSSAAPARRRRSPRSSARPSSRPCC